MMARMDTRWHENEHGTDAYSWLHIDAHWDRLDGTMKVLALLLLLCWLRGLSKSFGDGEVCYAFAMTGRCC